MPEDVSWGSKHDLQPLSLHYYHLLVKKLQSNWKATRHQLNQALSNCGLTPTQLANASDINYHAARRYLLRGATNHCSTALALCTFFGIPVSDHTEVQPPSGKSLDELRGAIESYWDGSEEHARLIVRLIESTRPFRVIARET